jgi:hypothetical protein
LAAVQKWSTIMGLSAAFDFFPNGNIRTHSLALSGRRRLACMAEKVIWRVVAAVLVQSSREPGRRGNF